MINVESEFQALLKELEVETVAYPKTLARLIFISGIVIGMKFGAEMLQDVNNTAELIDLAKKIIEKGR